MKEEKNQTFKFDTQIVIWNVDDVVVSFFVLFCTRRIDRNTM